MIPSIEKNTIKFSGILDEHFNPEKLKEEMIVLKQALRTGERIFLDLQNVKQANSCGIAKWIKLLSELNYPVTYKNAPIWLVEQFNLIREFFEGDILVESFYAPYYIPAKESNVQRLIVLGKDVQLDDDFSNLNLAYTDKEDNCEPDFDIEDYFSFLIENKDKLEHH